MTEAIQNRIGRLESLLGVADAARAALAGGGSDGRSDRGRGAAAHRSAVCPDRHRRPPST